MKKAIAIILSMLLVLALVAGCTKAGSGDEPTKAPDEATVAPNTTDAPSDATAAPTDAPEAPTDEPTATPEPTPEPFKDPYAIEILDYDEAEPRAFSFDTIKQNGNVLTDGGVATYRLEIEDTIDGKDGKTYEVTLRGWVGFNDGAIEKVGYQIDDGPVVFSDKFFEDTQQAVKDAGGEFAQRFTVDVPVGTLSGEGHELKVVVKLETGYFYLNPDANPFTLFYDGPAAEEHAIDGTIGVTEYSAKYTLDKSNAQTWTGTDMGEAKVEYYLDIRDGALYVGCVAENVNASDMIQLNFNPGARLEATTGLFVSFQAGDTLKVLQHNHKTTLKDDPNPGGVDITDLVEQKLVSADGKIVFEVKLPETLFQVTDVDGAAEFKLGNEKLYFGMFGVIGGGGYTNQSAAPGSSWNCVDLGIHEYFIK
jgi:hypothetical protein